VCSQPTMRIVHFEGQREYGLRHIQSNHMLWPLGVDVTLDGFALVLYSPSRPLQARQQHD
jgi:hypothetical protein